MEISKELEAGIARFASAIAPIVGETVAVTMRDGSVRVGKLSHDTPCQPIVTTDEGKRYAVPTSEIAKLFAEHPTESGAEWLALYEQGQR